MFDEIPLQDVVAWNTLNAGYTQNGFGQEALNCYLNMCVDGLSSDVITFTFILKARDGIQALEVVEEIHSEVLGNALVDMYAKCNVMGKAQEVFDELPNQTLCLGAYVTNALNYKGTCVTQNLPHVMSQFKDERCTHGKM